MTHRLFSIWCRDVPLARPYKPYKIVKSLFRHTLFPAINYIPSRNTFVLEGDSDIDHPYVQFRQNKPIIGFKSSFTKQI